MYTINKLFIGSNNPLPAWKTCFVFYIDLRFHVIPWIYVIRLVALKVALFY